MNIDDPAPTFSFHPPGQPERVGVGVGTPGPFVGTVSDTSRSARGVHAICDSYVDEYARLQPLVATSLGVGGHDEDLPDLSPDGHRAREELARRARAEMAAAQPVDESERVAKAVFAERLGLTVEMYDAGLPAASLNVIWSPLQEIRQAFDLMPTATAADWAVIAKRLGTWVGATPNWATTPMR